MLVDTELKGYLTETSTYFGRHCNSFRTLEKELKKEKPSSLSCLIIGPGIDYGLYGIDSKFTRTYQPFELANVLAKAQILDYNIDILDINPDVINELKKDPILLSVPLKPSNFTYMHQGKLESQIYFNSFFEDNTISHDNLNRVVEISKNVSSKFNLELADIIQYGLPVEKYDVVICTVLLSHYSRDMTRRLYNPIPATLKKIENSIKPGGYLIDTEKDPFDTDDWKCIKHFSVNTPSIHSESTSLFRKR